MTKEDIPPYLTIAQAATFSHFSEPTIRKAISDGKLLATKPLARDARIRREDFEQWMAAGSPRFVDIYGETGRPDTSGLQGPGGINFMDIRKLEHLRTLDPVAVARFEDEQGKLFLINLSKLCTDIHARMDTKETP